MDNNYDYEDYLPASLFYTKDELVQQYGLGYQIFVANTLLVKDEELYYSYKEDNLIEIKTPSGTKSISENLLMDLITNDGMYKYLLNHMDDSIGRAVRLALIKDGKMSPTLDITRAELSLFLNAIDPVKMSFKQRMRKAFITNLANQQSLLKRFRDVDHFCVIEGETLSFKVRDLLAILTLEEEEEFNDFACGKLEYEHSCEYMAFALVDFINRNRIFSKYVLPNDVLNRFYQLESYALIDFESLNRNRKTNDYDSEGNSLVDQVIIDEELKNAILKDMPIQYSPLEKAIYIYIKMCELLTYDQSFFANNLKDSAGMHQTVEQILKINLKNNSTVCYEYILIFAKFLKEELGILYTINFISDVYGERHINLSFKSSGFLIVADAVSVILLENDMSNAKMNAPIQGLKCINQNKTTKQKFDEILYKVSMEIIQKKENTRTFQESVRMYKERYVDQHIDTKDKLYVFLKDVMCNDLKGTDSITYQMKMYKSLFSDSDSVFINFISKKNPTDSNFPYLPLTLFTIKTVEGYEYMLIDVNSPEIIQLVSLDELEEKFDNEEYAYLSTKHKNIPSLERYAKHVR